MAGSGPLVLDDEGRFAAAVEPPAVAQRHGAIRWGRLGDLQLIADGRIHNRGELAGDLGLTGADSAIIDDAALVLRCWHRWDSDCLARLVGDYALALWDGSRRRLYLARDYMGQRVLHYRLTAGAVLFASTPSMLGGDQLDPLAWARYHLLLPQRGASSFFRDIKRVEPGTIVVADDGGVRVRHFWTPPPSALAIEPEEAVGEARRLLDLAVAERLPRPGQPAAAQLSSGMDSSAVASSAALQHSGPVIALTGAPSAAGEVPGTQHHVDEATIAARTAALYPNLVHRICTSAPEPLMVQSARWNAGMDQPVRSLENVGWVAETYRAAAQAGAGDLLSGNYGNLSLSYAGMARLAELLQGGRWGEWLHEARSFAGRTGARPRGLLLQSLGGRMPLPLWRRVQRWRAIRPGDPFAFTFIRPEHPVARELRDEALAHRAITWRPANSTREERLAGLDWVDNGLFNHAMRARFAVATSDPTADRRLVEFCLRLGPEHFFRDGINRRLARDVIAPRVPREVAWPETRGLQGSDWRHSAEMDLAGLAAEADQLARHSQLAELIDVPRLRAAIDSWPRSGWNDPMQVMRYRSGVLRTLHLGHWARTRCA